MRKIFIVLSIPVLCFFGINAVTAQIVGTLTLSQAINGDGIVVDQAGNIYCAEGWLNSKVYKIDTEGNVSEITSNLTGPTDITLKPGTDTLIVSNWNDGIINTLSMDGTIGLYVDLPKGTGGMVFDDEGRLYVAMNRQYAGEIGGIIRVELDGTWNYFATGGSIWNPLGLDIDENQNLYCSNMRDARVSKIDTSGNTTLVADINCTGSGNVGAGYLAYSNGAIYVTGVSCNKIFKVTIDGEISTFAGTGEYGFQDGETEQATFANPNGISFSPTGDTMFIRETWSTTNRIRFIYDLATSVENNNENGIFNNSSVEIYPNPIIDDATIHINILKGAEVNVSVYDVYGKIIERVVGSGLNPGHHKFQWTTENLQSGIYFCRVKIGDRLINRKLIVQ